MAPHARDLLIDSQCTLGEGATWCASSGRFYWTDIEGKRLWRYDPRDGRSVLAMPERLACFALCADPHSVAGARHAARVLRSGDGRDRDDHRGRSRPADASERRPMRPARPLRLRHETRSRREAIGGFYRLNGDLSLERLPLADCAISNSIAFSPDGATMYYCDSPTRQIRVCDYPTFGNDRVFSSFRMRRAFPTARPSIAMAACGMRSGAARVSCAMGPTACETARVDVPTRSPVALPSAARSSTRCT